MLKAIPTHPVRHALCCRAAGAEKVRRGGGTDATCAVIARQGWHRCCMLRWVGSWGVRRGAWLDAQVGQMQRFEQKHVAACAPQPSQRGLHALHSLHSQGCMCSTAFTARAACAQQPSQPSRNILGGAAEPRGRPQHIRELVTPCGMPQRIRELAPPAKRGAYPKASWSTKHRMVCSVCVARSMNSATL
eukprot:177919-Chlamydomonas_euryale.AAC.2